MRPKLVQAAVHTLLTAVSMEFAHGTSAACRRTAHLLRSTGTTISTEPIQPISSVTHRAARTGATPALTVTHSYVNYQSRHGLRPLSVVVWMRTV